MKSTILSTLLLASAAAGANAQEPRHFQLSGAAGWNYGSSSEAVHVAVQPSFALNQHFSIGADLAYSYLPLQRQARGGGNRTYWGLATLTANALPSSRVSPYLTLGYGFGRYEPSFSRASSGTAAALGAGLLVQLSPRASLFVESRFAMMGADAADGLHLELPVKVGVKIGF